jgi:hypothetical protein
VIAVEIGPRQDERPYLLVIHAMPTSLRAAERQARREGTGVSQLIRELLERYLAGKPGGVRG